MELLVLKVGEKYIRIISGDNELVDLKKASVFSSSDEEKVLETYHSLKLKFEEVTVKKLVITERNYFNEDNT